MGWGSRRWAKLAWAAVAALGLAALPAIAATNAAEGGNEKSGGTERGIRFGIDREEYDAQARAAMRAWCVRAPSRRSPPPSSPRLMMLP